MIRVAMLSKWHVHAEGYAKQINSTGKAQVVAVWDEDKQRGENWAKDLNVGFEPDIDKLLARNDIDAVVCCTPTTMHEEVITKAAKAGKHIFTEKALTPTVEGCKRVAKEIEKAGVTFTISYPNRFNSCVKFAKKCVDSGDLGRITMMRVRDAHNGISGGWLPEYWFEEKDAAGGAMMDLGCHPMYLLAAFCGEPKRISAVFNSPFGNKVDENSVSVIEFKNGAIGVSETGFVSGESPFMFEIYGTDGSLLCKNWEMSLINAKTNEISRTAIDPKREGDDLSPLQKFVDACVDGTGTPEGLGLKEAIDLTVLLENSYISNNTNTTVVLD